MKRVVIMQPHQLAVIETPRPEPGPGQALLKPSYIGICGSDLHVLEGKHPFVSYPVYPGHEVSGVVCKLGQRVKRDLLGKQVVLEPSLFCGKCRNCKSGRYNICENLRVFGFQSPGAMGEYFAVAADRLHVLPEGFLATRGALTEPSAVAVHALRLDESVKGREIAVIGAGTIGLLTALIAKAYGAKRVQIIDLDKSRLKAAQSLGLEATTTLRPQSANIIFECVGLAATLRTAIENSRKGGTIIVLGVFGQETSIPASLIQDWELRILGSLMYTTPDYQEAIRLLGDPDFNVEPVITHKFPLADANEAFATALKRSEVLKVLLSIN